MVKKNDMSFDLYTSLLKMFDEFHEKSASVNLSYELSNPNLYEIRTKYGLDDIIGKGETFSQVSNLLFWLSKNLYHNGNFDNFKEDLNAIKLLEYSYKKGKEYGINCRALSIILTECLLSLGFMARTIYLLPFSPYDFDNHVVTHVYIKELKKWVMLDPTFGCYVMNKERIPLNIFEIRELLANQDFIIFNKEIKYNDEKKDENSQALKEYYAKNLFYFTTREKSCFDAEKENRIIHILPLNYDVKRKEILNIEYRIKKEGDAEWIQNWLKDMKENKYLYISPLEIIKNQ